MAEDLRVRELGGQNDAHRWKEEQPEEPPGEPPPDQLPVDDVVVQAPSLREPRLLNRSGAAHAPSLLSGRRDCHCRYITRSGSDARPRIAGGPISSGPVRPGGGAVPAQPLAPSGIVMGRVVCQRAWRLHSAVTATSEAP